MLMLEMLVECVPSPGEEKGVGLKGWLRAEWLMRPLAPEVLCTAFTTSLELSRTKPNACNTLQPKIASYSVGKTKHEISQLQFLNQTLVLNTQYIRQTKLKTSSVIQH